MKHTIATTLTLILLFIGAQIIGLLVVNKYIDVEKSRQTGKEEWKNLPTIFGVGIERPQMTPTQSILSIITAILLGTIIFFVIAYFGKINLLKVWFYTAIVLCLHIAFGAFINSTLALAIALIFAFFKTFKTNIIIHNISELFIYGGLASIFAPLLTIKTVFLLLIFISAYDMYSVWKSKHMIKLAKIQSKTGMFAGLMIPQINCGELRAEKNREVKTNFNTMNYQPLTTNHLRHKPLAILGGGDIGFPLLFNSVILIDQGFSKAILNIPFATIALFSLLLLAKKNKFYPAMPFISAGCFTGYLILLFI